MPTFLITGTAGFIGSSIARALLAQGNHVRGVDNFLTGRPEALNGLSAMEFIEGDLSDPQVAKAACAGTECIFHHAALASVARSMNNPAESMQNIDSTLQLLIAARDARVKRLVYAGSCSAYGDSSLPNTEGMLADPLSPYAASKLASEAYTRVFQRVYGLETVILRYFNVFGPYQDPHSEYSGVLALLIRQMCLGETPIIYGDGEQSRDFTYIDDIVQANLLAYTASADRVSGRVFNIATGQSHSINHIVGLLRDLTGYVGPIRRGAARAGDIRHSLADISFATEQLGYKPSVTLAEGLRLTVRWLADTLPSQYTSTYGTSVPYVTSPRTTPVLTRKQRATT
jgi:UDP-glucose 4-epimerase